MALSATCGTKAEVTDSTLAEHVGLWRSVRKMAADNPALRNVIYRTSLSQLTLSFDDMSQTEAFRQELGDGLRQGMAGVNTFKRLSDNTSVWGTASYMYRQRSNVRWNSTTDFDILRPYVLADTLGGDTQGERYLFSGGYASRLGDLSLGAEMAFRAEQEYRDTDPRMRGVVTDLTLRGGAAYLTHGMWIGASLSANVYKQTNSVDFYNENGVIPEYQMTGLGTEYTRFSGDKRSLYHDGGGAALTLDLTPEDDKGLYAHITLDEHRYERKLADYNAMPLTKIYNEHAGVTVGWRKDEERRLDACVGADYTRRSGDENVGGESYAGSYPIIATLTMYKESDVDVYARAAYGHGGWTMTLKAGYVNNEETYSYPNRNMSTGHVYGTFDTQYMTSMRGGTKLTFDAGLSHSHCLKNSITMPYANMEKAFVSMIKDTFRFAKAHYTTVGLAARADFPLTGKTYGVFAAARAGITMCSENESQTDLSLSAGMTF